MSDELLAYPCSSMQRVTNYQALRESVCMIVTDKILLDHAAEYRQKRLKPEAPKNGTLMMRNKCRA